MGRCRLDLRRSIFSQRTIHDWNYLPEHVISCASLNSFKSNFGKGSAIDCHDKMRYALQKYNEEGPEYHNGHSLLISYMSYHGIQCSKPQRWLYIQFWHLNIIYLYCMSYYDALKYDLVEGHSLHIPVY